jgi:hypothetical protein
MPTAVVAGGGVANCRVRQHRGHSLGGHRLRYLCTAEFDRLGRSCWCSKRTLPRSATRFIYWSPRRRTMHSCHRLTQRSRPLAFRRKRPSRLSQAQEDPGRSMRRNPIFRSATRPIPPSRTLCRRRPLRFGRRPQAIDSPPKTSTPAPIDASAAVPPPVLAFWHPRAVTSAGESDGSYTSEAPTTRGN